MICHQINKDEVVGSCSTKGELRNECTVFFLGKSEGGTLLGISMCGRMYDVEMYSEGVLFEDAD